MQLILRRWGALDVFYAEAGAYPVASLTNDERWQAGPLVWVASPAALHVAFAFSLIVALAFTVGAGTRYVKWLLFPVLVSVHARNPVLFTGGEAVLHSQALYVALLPVHARYSVDGWLLCREQGAKLNGSAPSAVSSPVYPLILLQLAVIYWFNERAKMGATWLDGTAVARALGAATLATDFGAWIAQLPAPLLRCLTYGTLAIEGLLPFLLLSPWGRRRVHALAAALMLALHGGIYCALEVGSFSAAMLSYTPLLWHPKGETHRLLPRSQRARRLEATAVAVLFYLGAARLSHDLLVWPDRPKLPLPGSIDKVTRGLGLYQPWMMFSPDPPDRDFIVVTDAVTQKGTHFDPWRREALGPAEPWKELPNSVVRAHIFTRYENFLTASANAPLHPFFARWVLRQRGPDGAAVERFDAWLMVISTDPARVVAVSDFEARVGVMPLPFPDALPVVNLDAYGVWAPERAVDHKVVPEGTNVFTPVSAAMSGGCPQLTLDLGGLRSPQSAYIQTDSADSLWLEGSLDGKTFVPLAEMPRLPGRQHKSRVIALPGDATRFVRVRPVKPRGLSHLLSEIALFDHPVSLPPLPARPSEDFFSALARPAVVGIVSGSNHPAADCPIEDHTRPVPAP